MNFAQAIVGAALLGAIAGVFPQPGEAYTGVVSGRNPQEKNPGVFDFGTSLDPQAKTYRIDVPFWNDYPKVKGIEDQIVREAITAAARGEPINLIGFSWGGELVLRVAERLNTLGVKVNTLITIDPIFLAYPDGTLDLSRRVPDNVLRAINVYQNQDPLRGSVLDGNVINLNLAHDVANELRALKRREGLHTFMDESVVVRARILEVLRNPVAARNLDTWKPAFPIEHEWQKHYHIDPPWRGGGAAGGVLSPSPPRGPMEPGVGPARGVFMDFEAGPRWFEPGGPEADEKVQVQGSRLRDDASNWTVPDQQHR